MRAEELNHLLTADGIANPIEAAFFCQAGAHGLGGLAALPGQAVNLPRHVVFAGFDLLRGRDAVEQQRQPRLALGGLAPGLAGAPPGTAGVVLTG